MPTLISRIVYIVLCCGIHVCAKAADESGAMVLLNAKQFVESLISAVETKGMKPIDPALYQFARSRLLQIIDRESTAVDRKELYGASRELLGTLNTGGHTLLWSREKMASWQSIPMQKSSHTSPVVRAIRTESGTVLLVRPAPVLATDIAATREYAAELNAQIEAEVSKSNPCAVTVDLTDQTGGNAWPVLAALGALVTDKNGSTRIDRSNEGRPLFRPIFLHVSTQANWRRFRKRVD